MARPILSFSVISEGFAGESSLSGTPFAHQGSAFPFFWGGWEFSRNSLDDGEMS
jgi:hypothetical protein